MKSLALTLFTFLIGISLTNAQCPFDNTLINTNPAVLTVGACPGTSTLSCIDGGGYVQVALEAGNNYTFSLCGTAGSAFDTEMTVFDFGGTTVLGYNDDDCGLLSTVTYTPTANETVNVLIDEIGCNNTGTCVDLSITCNPPVQSGDGCNTDVTICTPGQAGPFGFSTPGNAVSSCLDWIGPNFAYITLYITQSGPLEMLIEGDAATGYLDVSLFNIPAGEDPCTAINDVTNEIECNYDNSALSDDCNQFGTAFPGCASNSTAPMVNAGDVIFIIVENYSGTHTQFTLDLAPAPAAQTGPADPTIDDPGILCTTDAAIQMTAVNNGGSWSGANISAGGMFDPTAAGAGTHSINYSLGGGPCLTQSTFDVVVEVCNTCSMVSATGVMTDCYESGGFIMYDMGGEITFTDAPTTGQLIIENCYGQRVEIDAPFNSPESYSFSGNPQSGDACDLNAFFTTTGFDDGSCTINIPFTEPTGFTAFGGGASICDNADNSYMYSGTIGFTTPPLTGTLVIEINDGIQTYDTIINPPFVSTIDWSISGMNANSAATTITAYFTDVPTCAISWTGTAPAPCGCAVDAGTFTSNTTVASSSTIDYLLCFGDEIEIMTDNNFTPPTNNDPLVDGAGNPLTNGAGVPITYNPGILYAVFTCPPTVSAPAPISDDPCFLGFTAFLDDFNDVNTLGGPSYTGTYTDNTIHYVPVTAYDITTGIYAIGYVGPSGTPDYCYDLGQSVPVQYLPEITQTNTSDCAAGSVTATINGGLPELNGSNFTASNVLPISASIATGTAANGGDIVINGLANGDMWSFDVSDDNGCPITISGGPFVGGPTANAGVTDTICALTYGLSATPSIGTGAWTGPAGISFSASTSATSNVTATAAGTYTLTWTETSGACSGSDNVDITFLDAITETNTSDCAAGSVTVTLNGGLPAINGSNYTASNLLPVSASFVNTTTTSGNDIVINGLADGDMWSFDVTDDNGCPTITISGGPFVGGPTANAGLDDNVCALTYTLSATPSIGTGAWTGPAGISFSNGISPTSNVTATAAGTYTLTWTETSGACVGSATVDITFSDPSFTYVANPAQCGVADGDITITASGGIAPYTFSIDNGTTTQLGNTFGTLTTNNYDGYIIDDIGCVFTNVIPVGNSGSPFIDAVNVTNPICGGTCDGQVEIVVSGGTPPYSYSLDGAPLVVGQDVWTNVCGSLTDLAILVEDAIGCQNTDVATVTDPTPVIQSSTPTHLSCFGDTDGSIIVIASGGDGNLTYFIDDGINPPTSQNNGNFLNLPGGTYTLTVTDGQGCSSASVVEAINEPTILVLPAISISPISCNGLCDGVAIANPSGGTPLGTTSGYDFAWSSPISSGNVPNATNVCAGMYNVTVTDAEGCSINMPFEFIDPPLIVFTDETPTDVSCFGSCDGQISVEAANATSYSIDGGAPVTAPNTIFTGLCAGTYTIEATQTAGACPVNTTVTVGTPDEVTLTSTVDTTICIGGIAELFAEATGGDGNYTFTWSTAETTPSISISGLVNSTLYDVSVVDGNGCSGGTSFSIVNLNNPLFVTALSDQSICPGGSADLSAFVSPTENGNGNVTYTWFEGTTQIGTGLGITVSPTATTTYTITVNDDCETPPHSADVTVTINTTPTVDFVPDNVDGCIPVVVDFSNIGVPVGSQFFWDFGDGNASNDENPTNTFTDPGCYDVSLSIIDANGCTNDITYPSLICGYPYPTAEFEFNPQPTTVLNTEIQFSNYSTGANQYEWTFGVNGSLGTSSDINPSLVFPSEQPGTYPVCLVVENASGCRDSVCYEVIIDDEFLVYVPNAFTPDGDGENDIFMPVITGANPLDYKFFVFNRWGELIFESYFPEIGWDGTYKGQISKTEVYVWKLELSSITNGEKKSYIGHVSLLK